MIYPKELFCIREDVTRENKRKYDKLMDDKWHAIQQREQELNRKMTARERYEFSRDYIEAHRFW